MLATDNRIRHAEVFTAAGLTPGTTVELQVRGVELHVYRIDVGAVTVDRYGRLPVRAHFRRHLGWRIGDQIALLVDGDLIRATRLADLFTTTRKESR